VAAKRILIADDEAPIRRLLSDFLGGLGYDIAEAANGRDAVIQIQSWKPQLLILDLVMPEQEGIETLRQIRATNKTVKVIAVSGAFAGQFLRTAELLGANMVLPKPLNLQQLAKSIGELLA
jgi:CheY-like chemotaxis protein